MVQYKIYATIHFLKWSKEFGDAICYGILLVGITSKKAGRTRIVLRIYMTHDIHMSRDFTSCMFYLEKGMLVLIRLHHFF